MAQSAVEWLIEIYQQTGKIDIFDLEVAFLLPWGVTLGLTGFLGYFVALGFLFLLTVGFIYEVVKGALNVQ